MIHAGFAFLSYVIEGAEAHGFVTIECYEYNLHNKKKDNDNMISILELIQ